MLFFRWIFFVSTRYGRDYFSVVTPKWLCTGNRVIIGSTDAVYFAQQIARRVLKPVSNQGVQIWLYYILDNAGKEMKLLDVPETVLE